MELANLRCLGSTHSMLELLEAKKWCFHSLPLKITHAAEDARIIFQTTCLLRSGKKLVSRILISLTINSCSCGK